VRRSRFCPAQSLRLLLLATALLLGACSALPLPTRTDPGPPPPILLQVDAPPALRTLLERHLDLARLAQMRSDETLDETEWARLVAAAPAQVRELAQTEGYFEAQVRLERTPGTPPRVRVVVQPGPQLRVAQLQVQTTGPLHERATAGDATARALQQQLQDSGPLAAGSVFRDSDWRDTKSRLLTRLRAAGYASATISASAADIDVPARSATLSMVIDSGPLYLAGPLKIDGLQHHDADTVRHLAGFGPGAPLTESRLLDYQDRLQKSGLFESISVTFEPDPATAEGTAISVRLKELPLQQATVGLGYSTTAGPRASLEHLHRRPFGWGVTAYNKLEWGRDLQRWNGDFQTHPGEGFYRNLLGVLFERLKGDEDTVLTQRLRLGRTTDTPRIERLYFAEVLRSRQELVDGPVIDAWAYSANMHWLVRRLDSVLLPTRGYAASLQLGAGLAHSNAGERGPFGRVYTRMTGYLPIGAGWYGSARGAGARRAGLPCRRRRIGARLRLSRTGARPQRPHHRWRRAADRQRRAGKAGGAVAAGGVGRRLRRCGACRQRLEQLQAGLRLRRRRALAQPHRAAAGRHRLRRGGAQAAAAPVGGHHVLTHDRSGHAPPTRPCPSGVAAPAPPRAVVAEHRRAGGGADHRRGRAADRPGLDHRAAAGLAAGARAGADGGRPARHAATGRLHDPPRRLAPARRRAPAHR
jgi:translocation and assembly module TamA